MSGAFAKIAGASTTGGGNNIKDGNYRLLIEKIHLQPGHTGECFIAEFRVLESTPNGATDEQGRPVTPNAAGSTCSIVCNITKHAAAAGNAKKMLAGALGGLGYTEADIVPEVMGNVCAPNNPMRGLGVICETYRGVNKGRDNPANAGKPLTLCNWKPIAQTEADMLAQRAYLDSNAPASAPVVAQVAAPVQAATITLPVVPAPLPVAVAQPAAPAGGGLLSFLRKS